VDVRVAELRAVDARVARLRVVVVRVVELPAAVWVVRLVAVARVEQLLPVPPKKK
jgi:hypothetical protein